MAYDLARHVTVLFGGSNAGSPNLSDTWEWNGTMWTLRPVGGPSARYFHSMAYDAGRGLTVLFGGTGSNGISTAETWEWNGTGAGSWTQRMISGPSPREDHAMAYDAAHAKTVLFGGYSAGWNNQTWVLGAAGGGGCGSADFNCDSDVGTDADIEAFFACLAGSCPAPPCASDADFNGDGDVGTDADIEAFFRVLAGGNC
jgi:hypothetical protein